MPKEMSQTTQKKTSCTGQVCDKMNRRKNFDSDVMETPLRRCLNTFDLTLFGIGHMVGAGLYVLTGTVVRNMAGPATVVSYVLAGIAALLSSLCYAELGSMVPKTGSAYTYTYVAMGEIWAFIIGWNMILEMVIGTASVARSWSGSLDAFFGNAIKNASLTYIGHINVPWISHYLDFVAFLIVIIMAVFVACGAKTSVNVNSVFTAINICVILFIMVTGFTVANIKNWTDQDTGGFAPMGIAGIFSGAATSFYAYIGYECIAVAGEEAKNPQKSIPVATGLAMAIVAFLYVGASTALTLMVPWYSVDVMAPFPAAFAERRLVWVKYIVAAGSLLGISTSLLGSMYGVPRMVFAIAEDGLFFRLFSRVNKTTQTPIVATVTFGLITAVFAMIFDMTVLVEFISIGSLLNAAIVSACILILRYRTLDKFQFRHLLRKTKETEATQPSEKGRLIPASQIYEDIGKLKPRYRRISFIHKLDTKHTTTLAVVLMGLTMAGLSVLLVKGAHSILVATWWSLSLLICLSACVVLQFTVLLMYTHNSYMDTYQVPFVPFTPALSMFVSILLMVNLSYLTWIRLIVWVAVGFILYFTYGIRNSVENKKVEVKHAEQLNGPGADATSTMSTFPLTENSNSLSSRGGSTNNQGKEQKEL